LPVVLSEAEVKSVRRELEGDPALVVGLLYGSGLRLMEALRLRVQDLDFEQRVLTVRDGKGGKDRRTLLPGSQCEALKQHLQIVRRLHQQDLAAGSGAVILPHALAMGVSPAKPLERCQGERRSLPFRSKHGPKRCKESR
jgi:integrase